MIKADHLPSKRSKELITFHQTRIVILLQNYHFSIAIGVSMNAEWISEFLVYINADWITFPIEKESKFNKNESRLRRILVFITQTESNHTYSRKGISPQYYDGIQFLPTTTNTLRCLRILPARSLASREERGWGWGEGEAVVDPRLPIRGRQRRINGGYMKNCGGSPSSVWSHPPPIPLHYSTYTAEWNIQEFSSKFCYCHPILPGIFIVWLKIIFMRRWNVTK